MFPLPDAVLAKKIYKKIESFYKSKNSIFKEFSVKLQNSTYLGSNGLNFYPFGPNFCQEDVLVEPNWI